MGINDTILVTHRGENNQDLYVENIQFFYVKFRHPSVNLWTGSKKYYFSLPQIEIAPNILFLGARSVLWFRV